MAAMFTFKASLSKHFQNTKFEAEVRVGIQVFEEVDLLNLISLQLGHVI